MTDPATLRARLVTDLDERGELPEEWRAALAQVERHAFIPPLVWKHEPGRRPNDLIPLHRITESDTWLEIAYADAPVDTQVDDGHPAADGTGHEVTSSASMPTIVAKMLRALDVRPGTRALEIGTGTGYNAALLAHRLGADNITSIELDPQVAASARAALDVAGYGKVTVITDDGAYGHPPGAPYDRIIATAGVYRVPYTWIAQTAPGGRVVLPLSGVYQPPGILTLNVHDDGSATGRFGGQAAFMALRAQRVPRPRRWPIDLDTGAVTHTDIHPHRVAGNRDAATAIGMRVASCRKHYDADSKRLWLLDHSTHSWAAITITPERPYEVHQAGRRQLWNEVHAAYQWWDDAGQPPLDAWRVTIDSTGQRVELSPPHQGHTQKNSALEVIYP